MRVHKDWWYHACNAVQSYPSNAFLPLIGIGPAGCFVKIRRSLMEDDAGAAILQEY